ncbi:hypothetical protein BDQ12DRAFT_617751 [Crucibulum laeve]|uniref:Protein-S-isoprenylcysteine O-methyltransferase n=1 Tax=Crucibulum laeve TaxID=68775 RepID=A0A5C3LGQ6_9AGAR|nr:hypothetical protein BDQ12DRAFT_617751 [Crucibulum laeve]
MFGAAEVAAILISRWSSLERWFPPNFKVGDTSKIYLSLTSVQGACFIVGGSFLRWKCNETFRGWLTSESSPLKANYILTSGPYSIVRHPTYTAAIMVYLGIFCWFGSRGSWVRESGVLTTVLGKAMVGTMSTLMLGAIAFGLIRMHDEDNLLRREFEEEWTPWAERVPNRLIPGVY